MVMDVCGAPALVDRVVREHRARAGEPPAVLVLGGAGKSGSLSLSATINEVVLASYCQPPIL